MTGVVVAGADPTTLLLAGAGAGAGADVTVLRRRDESPSPRAFAVHTRTPERVNPADAHFPAEAA